jgi:urease accessory protein
MKTRLPHYLAMVLATLLPAAAWAHPGHGEGFWPGFLHPFFGLDHLLAMVTVGILAIQIGGRALWVIPAAFIVAMAAGGALDHAGITLPLTEPLVAVSVLLLGLLLVSRVRIPVVAGALLVAVFAPFHGAAHAAELPALANFMTYALGFLLATALLHAMGILAAIAARTRPLILRLAAAPIALIGAWLLATRLA